MNILGITHKYAYNQAACLISDGRLVAFAEEERFTREKQAPQQFPSNAIKYCLKIGNLESWEIDEVAVGFNKIEDVWKTVTTLEFADYCNHEFKRIEFCRGPDLEIYYEADTIRDIHLHGLPVGHITWHDHHEAHVASAVATCNFHESILHTEGCNYISIDGDGGKTAGRTGFFDGRNIRNDQYFHCIGSIGCFYEEVTKFLGFKNHQGEGKVMGLASYGQYDENLLPRTLFFRNKGGILQLDRNGTIDHLEELKKQGIQEKVEKNILCEEAVNLAHTAQVYLEEVVIDAARNLAEKNNCHNFVLAGGSLLNCSANGKLLQQDFVERLFIQPASHDAGTALGAAILSYSKQINKIPQFPFPTAYWGSRFTTSQVEEYLASVETISYTPVDAIETLARLLKEDHVIGYFDGAAEVGPRALCHRSILANPTKKENLDRVNNVKGREHWRPLAPVIKEDRFYDIVKMNQLSPFMLIAGEVKEEWRSKIPAVTHVDNTCRPQSVNKTQNLIIHEALTLFEKETGCPVFMNTSFNLRGEPIVDSPKDAVNTFLNSNLDYLLIKGFLVERI